MSRPSGSYQQGPGRYDTQFDNRNRNPIPPYSSPYGSNYGRSRRGIFPGMLPGMFLGGLGRPRRTMMDTPDDYYEYGRPRRSSAMSTIVTLIIIMVVLFFFISMFGCSASDPVTSQTQITESAYNRQKIDSGIPYQEDCIIDETGYFENIPNTEKRLREFYDKTGVQPMIVMKAYDPSLKTDQQKTEYAEEYYNENIPNENVFLYMYFAEPDDSQVGYMTTVNGKLVEPVMDANARDIFWNYIDSAWTGSMSTDDMFVSVFDQTADRIMTKSTTKNDVMKKGLGIFAVLVVGGIIIALVLLRRKHERERAEETARILNAPLDPSRDSETRNGAGTSSDDEDDDLLKRYGGK